jgi:hypothetical protein
VDEDLPVMMDLGIGDQKVCELLIISVEERGDYV